MCLLIDYSKYFVKAELFELDWKPPGYLFRSQLGVEEGGAESTATVADIEAVALLVALCDAVFLIPELVDQGSACAGEQSDVLLVVLVVEEGSELLDQMGHIAVGVDVVGSLREVDGREVELGNLSWIVDGKVINDIE